MRYPGSTRPARVDRAAVVWWVALGCWCAGSVVGQFAHGPAAVALPYVYARVQAGPTAVALFGLSAVFLATLVQAMRDGARWSRPLLTVLGSTLTVVLGWQIGLSLLAGPPTGAALAQALPSLVALCAVPVAVALMHSSEVSAYLDGQVDNT